jgi:hypothetical protein
VKQADPLLEVVRNFHSGFSSGYTLVLHVHNRLPPGRASYSKTNVPGNGRRCSEPMHNALSFCTTPKHDQADSVPSVTSCDLHHFDAVFPPIKPLQFPYIGLNPSLLKDANAFHHQAGAELHIIGVPVAVNLFQLGRRGWHQELEQEKAVRPVQVVG